jgi:hypothetical protein
VTDHCVVRVGRLTAFDEDIRIVIYLSECQPDAGRGPVESAAHCITSDVFANVGRESAERIRQATTVPGASPDPK